MTGRRVLRSKMKAGAFAADDDEKFNFDIQEYEIDPFKPLKVVHKSKSPVKKNNGEDVLNTREKIKQMHLNIDKVTLDDITKQSKCFLVCDSDEPYEAYHKKMFKQETRMINDDKIESENEAERLQHIYETLDMLGWEKVLAQVTVIRDVDDQKELKTKRELTKLAIQDMLSKFQDMKRRISMQSRNSRHGMYNVASNPLLLYSNLDRSLVYGYSSSSDEEEDCMTIDQIRQHRKTSREKKFGGSLVIQLSASARSNARYAIIAEPLRSPYVIKYTKDERDYYKKKLDDSLSRFNFLGPLPDQLAVFKEKNSISLILEPKALRPMSANESDGPSQNSLSTIDQIRKFRVTDTHSADSSVSDINPPSSPIAANNTSQSVINILPVKRNGSTSEKSSTGSKRLHDLMIKNSLTDITPSLC
ncbi:Sas4p Ecym_4185 [Eremothecium cymbalariae DBVPG|uniref:Something about silencing protein 4 domain-containing protein n=1 Tax=Eremothecium cymbalariae (strain CBS 270.75 / DBVPG 7215 / KCTC 17166 / NRRL Y-17582) TaxID=931890 RepID=G8JTA8_ERECY|nr:hypothetical protein Ecym_4185 [Eremothecium cymbalariae DBVPG\